MLQNYLNLNLINITDDDDHKKLRKASDELTKRLSKSKTKVALYTLTAIDHDVNPESPAIIEVKDLIIKHWTTFTANAKDTPLVFIRAVILESLNNLVDKENFAEVIWFTSRNIIRFKKLVGNEKNIITEFLKGIGVTLNKKGIDAWSIEEQEGIIQKPIELKEISKYLINDDELTKYLEDASGPSNKDGVANYASPNPVWSNSAQTWSHEFASRASKGIAKSVDSSLKAIKTIISENNMIIQNALNFKPTKNSGEKNIILALRSQLLWWKEAAYSDTTDQAYNELDRNIVGLIMAYDYSLFLTTTYPKSVDYFLKHAYNSLIKEDIELSLNDFFEGIEKEKEILKTTLSDIESSEELPNLLNFTVKLLDKQVSISQLTEFTGIPIETKLAKAELVLWFFHDFLLYKLLKQK